MNEFGRPLKHPSVNNYNTNQRIQTTYQSAPPPAFSSSPLSSKMYAFTLRINTAPGSGLTWGWGPRYSDMLLYLGWPTCELQRNCSRGSLTKGRRGRSGDGWSRRRRDYVLYCFLLISVLLVAFGWRTRNQIKLSLCTN